MPTLATSLPALAAAGLTVLAPAVVPGAAHAAAVISCTVSGQAQYLPGAQRLLRLERSTSRREPWNCVDHGGTGVTAARLRASFNGVTPTCGGRATTTTRGRLSGDDDAFDRVFTDRDADGRSLSNRIVYNREGRSLADRIVHDQDERNLADRVIHDRDGRNLADRVVYDRERWGQSDGVIRDRAAAAGPAAPAGTGTVTIDWTVNGTRQTSKASARIVEIVHDTAKVSGTIQSGPFRGKAFTGRFDTYLLGGSGTCVSGSSGSVLHAGFKGQFNVG
ncbi:hypothetical protein [Nonomuraea sp. NPDC049684]|uniref:hypothetical protein n=1 Tax=Nonomuraea sp. NPDC049684 TaxID=3364356 RepID=UPI0037B597C4